MGNVVKCVKVFFCGDEYFGFDDWGNAHCLVGDSHRQSLWSIHANYVYIGLKQPYACSSLRSLATERTLRPSVARDEQARPLHCQGG